MQEKVAKRRIKKTEHSEHDMREVESYRQLFGRKQYTAGGFELKSTWWKHPTRNSDGSLRTKEPTYPRFASPRTRELFCTDVHAFEPLMQWGVHSHYAAMMDRKRYG